MLKNQENNGTEEIGSVTPTPEENRIVATLRLKITMLWFTCIDDHLHKWEGII